jgi:4-hydroxybenzoyl-CoA thioesterase
VGRPYPEVFRQGLGCPTVKLEMEFLSPVHYGDHVEVAVVVEQIGRSSVRIRYEGAVGAQPVFRARNTVVVVDMKTFRSVPVPDWLKERLHAAMEPAVSR